MTDLLREASPDADALLGLCLDNADDRLLDAIAAADYETDVAAHRAALGALLRAPTLFAPLAWHPREVLSLTRWCRPEVGEGRDRFGGPLVLGLSERHWARALAATLLLRAEPEEGENETLAALIASARYLGPRAERAASGLIAFRLAEWPGHPGDGEAFFWFGLGYLGLRAEPQASTAWLDEVAARAERAEAARGRLGPSSCWLLRTTFHDQLHGLWQGFATDGWYRADERPEPATGLRALCARLRPELARGR